MLDLASVLIVYGWDYDSVYTALAENISDPVLKDFDNDNSKKKTDFKSK